MNANEFSWMDNIDDEFKKKDDKHIMPYSDEILSEVNTHEIHHQNEYPTEPFNEYPDKDLNNPPREFDSKNNLLHIKKLYNKYDGIIECFYESKYSMIITSDLIFLSLFLVLQITSILFLFLFL